MSRLFAAVLLTFAAFLGPALVAQDWQDKWFTSRGVLELEVKDGKATGKYGDERKNTLTGTVAGTALSFDAAEGESRLSGKLELTKDKHAFTGTWNAGNNSGSWRGWRLDPAAAKAKAVSVAGPWRTSWGLMELEQKGSKLTGGFGAQGWSTVEGDVQGRRVTLQYRTPSGTGMFTADVEADGSAMSGGAGNSEREWPWLARKLDGYSKNVTPKPGAIVQGLAKNRLTYYLRAPKNWKPGAAMSLIVILHGSNMGARPYVESMAATELAERCLIAGIDGEQWQDWSEPADPRHNYTYVNWMGRSTYQGYPNTDRESPALVGELLHELRAQLKPAKVFVGGHSQGGFLSWFSAMHFPEEVDGVFPISCGLVMQCEPDVFAAAPLKAAQRKVAIAVVHGEQDPNVPFSQGEASWRSCSEHGFPMLRLFHNQAGHGFSSLPWLDAVHWLEAITGDDAEALLKWADQRIDEQGYHDAAGALVRLRAMKLPAAVAAKAKDLAARLDSFGLHDAERFVVLLDKGEGGAWVEDWLKFRDQFEFADCAAAAMQRFATLREKQEKPALELCNAARGLFQKGQREAGWAKYQELVDQCWASSWYSRVQGWLRDRR